MDWTSSRCRPDDRYFQAPSVGLCHQHFRYIMVFQPQRANYALPPAKVCSQFGLQLAVAARVQHLADMERVNRILTTAGIDDKR